MRSSRLPFKTLAGATVVFDLDGTLVDTAPDIMGALNTLLAEEGMAPASLAHTKSMIGRGGRALMALGFEAAGHPLTEPRVDELFRRFTNVYRGRIARDSRPFPDVVAALDSLAAQGARLAVCTNKRTELSVALLGELGLLHRFAAVVGSDSAPAAKPDPRHLLAAIERAGGRPDQAVMVGDSVSDAESARAAGVPLILVDFGYTDIPARDLAPDILIGHFDELPAACARLLGAGAEVIAPSPAADA